MFWIATLRENGYLAVLDTSAQGSPVVYGSSQADITQDVVRLYDQAYPIKAGTPAAAALRPRSLLLRLPLRQKSPHRNAFAVKK